MNDDAAKAWDWIKARLEGRFEGIVGAAEREGEKSASGGAEPTALALAFRRAQEQFAALFEIFRKLWGDRWDWWPQLEEALFEALSFAASGYEGPRLPDRDPLWFRSEKTIGGMCYTDRWAGGLEGLRLQIPYFKEIGLTYLHLMPLFEVAEGAHDGGYAVKNYRAVRKGLGGVEELRALADELARNGIRLVLDFIINHTSDEHEWARRAREGDPEFSRYYWFFPDRREPDEYDRALREIFPDQRRGSFTWLEDRKAWVWTTFHSYQWDLNYRNPEVFRAMAREMCFLAGLGVSVLRLDAIAFVWKDKGTTSENRPGAHLLIQAYAALAKIAAPWLEFKSEAIVHPDEISRYIGSSECRLSYNPTLMACLWEALATRETKVLRRSMQKRLALPEDCSWVNYVRCHDDIGWTFADEDAAEVGVRGGDHRRFLNDFYLGAFPGSFACGLPFGENPVNGDVRISGTTAALAGLERAERLESPEREKERELAFRRILLLHDMILTIGGVPLIYLGDEWGQGNDYGYAAVPEHAQDSRWVHRPARDLQAFLGRGESALFREFLRHLELRRSLPVLGRGGTRVLTVPENPHLWAHLRFLGGERLLFVANFSEHETVIPRSFLRAEGASPFWSDKLGAFCQGETWPLGPYQTLWLIPSERSAIPPGISGGPSEARR